MMNDSRILELLRGADPATGVDRSPESATARRLYQEARRRADADATKASLRRPSGGGRTRAVSWRRVLVLAAALTVVAVALTVVPSFFFRGTPAYAIKQLPNGVIVVDWSADSFSPNADAIAVDLRQYGIDVQITTTPASPSAVGQVTATFPGEGSRTGQGPPPGLTVGNAGTPEAFTWTIDPMVFHGPVTLDVAVPPQDGQPYVLREEVFEPGEVLAGLQCALGTPLRAADVAARLPDLGLRGEWNVVDPASVTPDGYHETRVDEVPDGVILWGYAVDANTVEFTVAPDGTPLDKFPPAHLSDVPCTPEQAARWK
jgi:hypothetical protein